MSLVFCSCPRTCTRVVCVCVCARVLDSIPRTHMHIRTRARARARAHTHTHTHRRALDSIPSTRGRGRTQRRPEGRSEGRGGWDCRDGATKGDLAVRVLALRFAAKSAALVSPSAPSPGPGGNAGGSEGLDGQAVALVCGALAKRRGFGGRVGGDGAAAGAGGLALRGAGRTQDGAQHGAQVVEEAYLLWRIASKVWDLGPHSLLPR